MPLTTVSGCECSALNQPNALLHRKFTEIMQYFPVMTLEMISIRRVSKFFKFVNLRRIPRKRKYEQQNKCVYLSSTV